MSDGEEEEDNIDKIDNIDNIDNIDAQKAINIDLSWLSKFEEEEIAYRDFYAEDVIHVKLYFCYINTESDHIENVTKETLFLQEKGILTRAQLINCIKRGQCHNQISYKLYALLRYNINLTPDEVPEFLKGDGENYRTRFLTSEKYLNDIIFPTTINIFNDLNAFFIIFKSKSVTDVTNKYNNTTRRIKFTSSTHRRTRRV
jgi:hypothetical protein